MSRLIRTTWLPLLMFIGAASAAGVEDVQPKATPAARGSSSAARVHIYPDVLTSADELTDGDGKKTIKIEAPTTLIWIDRMPDARFEHPTEYVLISAEKTRVIKGGWWPVLNGKRLFGDDAATNVKSPISFVDDESNT